MKKVISPNIKVQHDYYLHDLENEKFWSSCCYKDKKYFSDFKWENSKLKSSSHIFSVSKKTEKSISINCSIHSGKNKLEKTMTFQKPDFAMDKIHTTNPKPTTVNCIDISPEGGLGVSGSTYGNLRVWKTSNGELLRELKTTSRARGHVGDIYCCKFFPSSKVVLSAGADLQIKIWRIHDSLCAVTLIGHKRGVKRLSLIDRGRNFVSCSSDGTVRLWDCASQSLISDLYQGDSPINDCFVESNEEISIKNQTSTNKKEFNTKNSVVLFASQDGRLNLVDIVSRKTIFTKKHEDPLTSCLISDFRAMCGSSNGEIIQFDLRNTKEPISSFTMNRSSILSMKRIDDKNLIYSTYGGSCNKFNFKDNSSDLSFIGADDPIYEVTGNKDFIFSACRDGKIRKYDL